MFVFCQISANEGTLEELNGKFTVSGNAVVTVDWPALSLLMLVDFVVAFERARVLLFLIFVKSFDFLQSPFSSLSKR